MRGFSFIKCLEKRQRWDYFISLLPENASMLIIIGADGGMRGGAGGGGGGGAGGRAHAHRGKPMEKTSNSSNV